MEWVAAAVTATAVALYFPAFEIPRLGRKYGPLKGAYTLETVSGPLYRKLLRRLLTASSRSPIRQREMLNARRAVPF